MATELEVGTGSAAETGVGTADAGTWVETGTGIAREDSVSVSDEMQIMSGEEEKGERRGL